VFSVVRITFLIKTVSLKSEAEIVCSMRRWKRQDYSSLSTLIRSNENYLLKGQKNLLILFLLSDFIDSPVFSVFLTFFFHFFSCVVNKIEKT